MTEESKVEVELHDEDINDIVEDTLEEGSAPAPKGKPDANATDEEESIASVDKAADATKAKQAPAPKTKAGMINAMSMKLHSMKKDELTASYGKMMGEDVEVDDAIVETQVDTSAELDALVESEATLSDEFKAKTAVIFEAAVKSKLSEEIDRIESQYKEELAEEISSTKADLVEKVDSYLNYVVESWMEENQVAIQSGLRTEIAETFMDKMKDLFTESYIEVPTSKVDLVDELAESVEELETRLNETTQKVIDTTEELEVYKRETIIREASRDLAETQVEKLKSLVEGLDFEDEDQFASKVKTVKESYFTKEITDSEEVEQVVEDADVQTEVSSVMEQYISTIRKNASKS
tara:strand:- start:2008 stop:3060 length:1053 start_codon:yes stop_codon:yes gene_type:complete